MFLMTSSFRLIRGFLFHWPSITTCAQILWWWNNTNNNNTKSYGGTSTLPREGSHFWCASRLRKSGSESRRSSIHGERCGPCQAAAFAKPNRQNKLIGGASAAAAAGFPLRRFHILEPKGESVMHCGISPPPQVWVQRKKNIVPVLFQRGWNVSSCRHVDIWFRVFVTLVGPIRIWRMQKECWGFAVTINKSLRVSAGADAS